MSHNQRPHNPLTKTLVVQSQRDPLPNQWLVDCLRSVKNWSKQWHFDYCFLGDELFADVPETLLQKTRGQRVVATDIARLLVIKRFLKEGYSRVVWCDADFLVFDPDSLLLPDAEFACGREVWIQPDKVEGTPKAFIKVHNAMMLFAAGNSFLEFYIESALRMVAEHEGRFVPQFIGPKLLTALHNIVHFPVIENAGMLSPTIIRDIIAGSGPGLELFLKRSPTPLAAANLCSSLALKGSLLDTQMDGVIRSLLSKNHSLK